MSKLRRVHGSGRMLWMPRREIGERPPRAALLVGIRGIEPRMSLDVGVTARWNTLFHDTLAFQEKDLNLHHQVQGLVTYR